MAEQRCSNCRYCVFSGFEDETNTDGLNWNDYLAECRRFPPQPMDLESHARFSIVYFKTTWCGEWQPAAVSKPTGSPAKLRTPRVVAEELGLPPRGFTKIRMFARRAGVTPAAMADNIPLYDFAGLQAIRDWIQANHPKILDKKRQSAADTTPPASPAD